MDVCGLRVVTLIDALTKGVGALIKREFEVDPANSGDKIDALGVDKVGYRSVHYICRLNAKRRELAEYAEFADLRFEIQVRSILQHGWAEIEHDRRFKYPGELPPDLSRQFALLAGNLELLDRDFDRLVKEVDARGEQLRLESASPAGKTTRLTVDVVSGYLAATFKKEIEQKQIEPRLAPHPRTVLRELRTMGVKTLGDLHQLVPPETSQKHPWLLERTSFRWILRYSMILRDPATYFAKVYNKESFNWIDSVTFTGLVNAGVPAEAITGAGLTVFHVIDDELYPYHPNDDEPPDPDSYFDEPPDDEPPDDEPDPDSYFDEPPHDEPPDDEPPDDDDYYEEIAAQEHEHEPHEHEPPDNDEPPEPDDGPQDDSPHGDEPPDDESNN